MGFIAPALPWIAKGAGMLGGALLGRQRQKAALKRTPEEQAALTGASGAAGTLAQTGSALTGAGQAALAPATNYYQTLLHGNRGAQAQATAAPAGAIRDLYSGAERGLSRLGRTATAQAREELGREQAGKLAGLVTGVQPGAAAALTDIGHTQTGQGVGATGAAGSIYSNLLGQAAQRQQQAQATGADTGQQIGGFLFDLISGLSGKKKTPGPWAGGYVY